MTARRGEAWLDALCPLGVIAAVLYLYAGTLSPLAFQTHEALHPYARTLQLIGEVERGHLPPQVFPDAAGGAGAAFPRYYPPLSHSIAAGVAALLGDPVRGVNLAFLLALLASALATYALVRCVAGDPVLAACGALLAVSAPYRLGQVFVRGALAETWSLALYPLLLLGAWQAVERGRPPAWLAWAVAALLLTHQIVVPFALPLFVVLGALALRAHGLGAVQRLAVAGGLGAGLAAFFLLPQSRGTDALRLSDPVLMGATPEAVASHRVRLGQLFEAPDPDRWFGLSRPGDEPDAMSFALGWGPLLAFPLAALVAMRSAAGRASARRLGILLAGYALLTLLFVVAPAPLLAVSPPLLAYLQFPWRLLGLASLCASAAVPLCLASLGRGSRTRGVASLLGLAAVAAVPGFEREALSRPEWTRAYFTPELVRGMGGLGYTVQGEYLPRGFDLGPRPPAVALPYRAPSGASLVLPLHAFDFYRAEGAGKRLATGADGPWLVVRLPPGARLESVRPVTTGAFRLGLAVSGLALAAWLARSVRDRRRDFLPE